MSTSTASSARSTGDVWASKSSRLLGTGHSHEATCWTFLDIVGNDVALTAAGRSHS